MNVRDFWNSFLNVLGSTDRVSNVNEFRSALLKAYDDVVILNVGDVEEAIADKTEIDALVVLGGTITGATANDTMTAVADATAASTDTSAASLTSVNAAIASIEDNFADLQAKVNAIIAALKA